MPALRAQGWDQSNFEVHDYATPDGRELLASLTQEVELPGTMASFLYAFVSLESATVIVEGHVPGELIQQTFSLPQIPARLAVSQREMHGEPKEYDLWAGSEVETFPISTPLNEALARLPAAPAASEAAAGIAEANLALLLPTVLSAGLLDGINPCAFAVILLLIAFLFTIRQSRSRILGLGGAYIGVIYIVYFAIGLGLLRAVTLFSDSHFVARIGAYLVIVLGLINLKDYFFPQLPIHLHMPSFAHERANELLKKATLPATLLMGFLVGLCTFPCAGGVYVSIITLLAAKTTYAWGIVYLVLYNIMFILPLVIILLLAGNRLTAKAWARWERGHARSIRLWYGAAMVGLGAVMIVWVI